MGSKLQEKKNIIDKKENFIDKKGKFHHQQIHIPFCRSLSRSHIPAVGIHIPTMQPHIPFSRRHDIFLNQTSTTEKRKFHRQKRKISSPTNPYTLLSIPMPQSYTSGWKPYTNVATSYPLLAHSRDNFETPKIDNVPDLNDQRRKFQYQHPCPLPIAGNQFFSTIFGLTRH
jgi:hypothetical protein